VKDEEMVLEFEEVVKWRYGWGRFL